MFSAGDAVGGNDAPAQHRHFLELCRRRLLAHEGVEALGLVGRDIEEVERRRFRRQFVGELSAQVAVDLDHRDQQRDAKAERQHDGRRQRARPMDIGDRHAQAGCAGARCAARQDHHQCGDDAQQQKNGGGRGDIDERDTAIVGQQNGETRPERARRGR